MKTIRIGVAGYGAMDRYHAMKIQAGLVPGATLAAVADSEVDFSTLPECVTGFRNAEEMMASGTIDAVVIATPHYSHTSLGIYAVEQGLHVLVEKFISVHKVDAERLIAAHKSPKQAKSSKV